MRYRVEEVLSRNNVPVLAAVAIGIVGGIFALNAPEPKWIAAGVVGMVAMLASVIRIDWGIALLSFVTYSGISDALSFTYHAPPVLWPLIALLLVAGLLHWILMGERTSGWGKPVLFIAGYYLVCVSSLIWATDQQRTMQMLYELTQGVVICLAVLLLLQDENGARKALWGIIAAGAIVGTINVYQYLTGTFGRVYWGLANAELRQITIGRADYRVTGSTHDANFFGQIMLVIVPIAAERMWHERRPLFRALAIWGFFASLGAVIFTFSRGAFLSLIIVAGLVLLRARPRPSQWAALILAGLIGFAFLPGEYKDRIYTLAEAIPGVGHQGTADPAIKGRTKSLAAGLLMFVEHPLVGVGYGNYPRFYQQYSRRMGVDPVLQDRSAHSMYIEIATEGGLVGLLSFGLLAGYLLLRLRRTRTWLESRKNKETAAMVSAFYYAFIGYLVAALFLHTAYPRYFWLLIGIGFALPKAFLEQRPSPQLEKDFIEGGAAAC